MTAPDIEGHTRSQDTDFAQDSIHHTLGTDRNQASPGNHIHDARNDKRYVKLGTFTPIPWTVLTLGVGWSSYGVTGYALPEYMMDSFGMVTLRGMVTPNSGTTGYSTTITTIPATSRPGKREPFPASVDNGYGRTDVVVDGTVVAASGGTTAGTTSSWRSLSGIRFQAV